MRTWLWTLLLLGVAVALAVAAQDHAGNVVVLLPPYRIEMSLAFAVTAIVLLFILLHVILRLTGWTFGVGERVRNWRQHRSLLREHDRLQQGWVNLLQGQYVQAEHDFDTVSRRAQSAARRVLASLSAARASLLLNQAERVEASLEQARREAATQPDLVRAVACTAADIFLKLQRPQDALAWMRPVQEATTRYVHVQRLLLRVYLALPDWPAALKLARSLARSRQGEPGIAAVLERAAANSLRTAPDHEARRTVWKSLKSSERTLPEVALAGAQCFADKPEEVRTILQNALDLYLDPRLLAAYARCEAAEAPPRLERAEHWLRVHPNNPDLLRVLGDLCLRARLWGSAGSYLQRSLEQREDPRTHALLGTLYDHLGRTTEAVQHWRLATTGLIGLTVLDRIEALPAADTQLDPVRMDAEVNDLEPMQHDGAPRNVSKASPGASSGVTAPATSRSVTHDASAAPTRAAPTGIASTDHRQTSDSDDEMYELGAVDLPPRPDTFELPDRSQNPKPASST